MIEIKFKDFLIIENKVLFSNRLGDIMNALEELINSPTKIGKDKNAKNIVNQIRSKLLRTKWSSDMKEGLKVLQNCAANIMMSLDPKKENRPDLDVVLKSCQNSLKKLSSNLDSPINNIMSPEG